MWSKTVIKTWFPVSRLSQSLCRFHLSFNILCHQIAPLERWYGPVYVECITGFYGANCTESCQCANNATCNPKNGRCRCQPGWRGRQCDQGLIILFRLCYCFNCNLVGNEKSTVPVLFRSIIREHVAGSVTFGGCSLKSLKRLLKADFFDWGYNFLHLSRCV